MYLDNPFFYLISGTLLLLVALITTFKPNRDDRLANFFLASYFWCYGLSVIMALAVVFGYALSFPHLFRLSFFPGALIMPFSFLYISRRLYAKKLAWYDLIHLLPFLLYFIDYLPFLLLSADEKLRIYMQEAKDPMRFKLAYGEGWFMPDFGHVILRYILFFGYWLLQVFMLRRALRNPNHPLVYQDTAQKHWLQILVGSQLLALMLPLLALYFGGGKTVGYWINVAAIAASLIQVYYLIFHPEVLYSLDTAYVAPEILPIKETVITATGESPEASDGISGDQDLISPIQTSVSYALPASEDALDITQQVVEAHMHTKKPYTKTRYGIRDLSAETSIPVYRLSQFINQRYQVNFYGYINQFRIKYFITKIAAGEHEVKTLEALAQECGFQSRATFVRAFKVNTGFTPSQFISQSS
jgi:AraC-like DNA-binding protein